MPKIHDEIAESPMEAPRRRLTVTRRLRWRMIGMVALIATVVGGCRSAAAPGAPTPREVAILSDSTVQAALRMSFQEFDQNMHGGWRAYEQQGQYQAAATLIDRYGAGREGLRAWQHTLLRFHAGQMYAFAADTTAAIARFTAAVDTSSVGPGWAPYVRATIAFIRGDRVAFDRAAADLRAADQPGGPDPNIRVIEALARHFDRGYAEAYRAVSR